MVPFGIILLGFGSELFINSSIEQQVYARVEINNQFEVFPILTLILVIGIIYFYRREQLKKITEDVDKARIKNIDVFYSYLVSLILVTLVVLSAILAN